MADAIANARAQRGRERAPSSPATSGSPCASSSSAPGARRRASSTRRAPASRRRSCAGIVEAAPRRIVYVSCNPTTLAPNAAQLGRGRLPARPRAPGRHVPADAAHRVRGAARARGVAGRRGDPPSWAHRANSSADPARVPRAASASSAPTVWSWPRAPSPRRPSPASCWRSRSDRRLLADRAARPRRRQRRDAAQHTAQLRVRTALRLRPPRPGPRRNRRRPEAPPRPRGTRGG